MEDFLKRFIKDEETDRDKKEMGQMAKDLLDDPKFQLIEAILLKYMKNDDSPYSTNSEISSNLYWFGKGLNSLQLGLDKIVLIWHNIVEAEKEEHTNEEPEETFVSYGEGVDTSRTEDLL